MADAWVNEDPETLDAVIALIDFVGVIAADELTGEALRDGDVVSDETDALHTVIACGAASAFLNERAVREWLERRRATYGPSGVPPKRTEAANDAVGAASRGDPLATLGAEMDALEALAANVPSEADEISKKLVTLEDRAADLTPRSLGGAIVVLRVLVKLAADHDWNDTMDRMADRLIACLQGIATARDAGGAALMIPSPSHERTRMTSWSVLSGNSHD
jgi:hypothetical protein